MQEATLTPRTDLDLKHVAELLGQERAELEHQLDELAKMDRTGGDTGETGDLSNYDQHDADQGTELFLREQDQAIHDNLKKSLDQVESAWRKLQAGTYGYCERCHAAIPKERLEIMPSALFCMKCADELETQV